MMKNLTKLIIATPAVALLAACATTPPVATTVGQIESFTCENDANVNAQYATNGDWANLTITMPELGLDNQAVTLKNAVTASGMRFVNDTNPNSTYEWHTKGDIGILSIIATDGNEYAVSCQK